jgi:hypothetical protein
MALFKRKAEIEVCGMCGLELSDADRFQHRSSHIVIIGETEPSWLPEGLRAVALGEYTFRCDRCNSYPDIKWAKEGAALSALDLHLGSSHNVGSLKGAQKIFNMIPIG